MVCPCCSHDILVDAIAAHRTSKVEKIKRSELSEDDTSDGEDVSDDETYNWEGYCEDETDDDEVRRHQPPSMVSH